MFLGFFFVTTEDGLGLSLNYDIAMLTQINWAIHVAFFGQFLQTSLIFFLTFYTHNNKNDGNILGISVSWGFLLNNSKLVRWFLYPFRGDWFKWLVFLKLIIWQLKKAIPVLVGRWHWLCLVLHGVGGDSLEMSSEGPL